MKPEISRIILFAALLTTACLVNIPLGALRSRQRKLSAKWFLFVHLSIPLIYFLRTTEHFGYWAIPPLIVAAVCGQILGGRAACPRSTSTQTSAASKTSGAVTEPGNTAR